MTDFEFAQFRQHLGNRPQRRVLGIHLDQAAALGLLGNEPALLVAYRAWRERSGLPEDPVLPTEAQAAPVKLRRWNLWKRLRRH